MELPKKYFEASNSFFLVYLQVIILLSYCNLHGLNMLCLATKSPVIRGNVTDQLALLQFKAKITGDQLKIMESWNSSSHFCQWRGVTCDRKHQRVTKLELQFLKLSGSLSPYIGNLSFLKGLNLANNNFYNQIPQEFGRLRRLETLELSNNSLSGEIPSNLSACSMLTFVHMRSNQLKGEIPASLGLLSNLIHLRFYNNSLTGSIPPSLGNLSSLKELHLALNGLTGNIPETLVRLTNLSFFSIGGNAIFGIVPVGMFNLSSIRVFDIGGNKIQDEDFSCLSFIWYPVPDAKRKTKFYRNKKIKIDSVRQNERWHFFKGIDPTTRKKRQI
ncbi:LRR receptor-like serine/threonine-protein kinase EFR [Gossypium raimondii]|uniref:LRR receptor-like serine/threonine-protein kinase EFR n=1 Tax=Gossypium raimondii TaxID=29730 RepID=UPI00227AE2F5|nr:LRR receptor-like serine/threonine-protein kinase EFR [Gossypium raimondii]